MNDKPSLLQCSDAHLRLDRGDTFYAFEQIVDLALEYDVDIVGAGDMIDRQTNRAPVIAFLARQMRRLGQAGKQFFYIVGQHDGDPGGAQWLDVADNTVHLHQNRVLAGNGEYVLYGLDWQPSGVLQDELIAVPAEVTLLVAHQVWSDWMGSIAAPQGEFRQIPEHIEFLHTGDLHLWKLEKHLNAGARKMQVLSTGATTQLKADEPTEHYCALLYPGRRVEKVALKSRAFRDSPNLLSPEDADRYLGNIAAEVNKLIEQAAARELPEALWQPAVRVSYSTAMPEVVRRVEQALAGKAILSFRQLVPEARQQAYAAAKVKLADAQAATPLGVLGAELDQSEYPETYALCERLLNATDPSLEFAAWRTEYLAAGPADDAIPGDGDGDEEEEEA